MILLILVNSLIFSVLSGLHVYWALGGRWAKESVLPTSTGGELFMKPGLISTFGVAMGLFILAAITLANASVFRPFVDMRYIRFGMWTISILFALRAIGDFRFVGFTKKVKNTSFADLDTKLYSPLCAWIAIISCLITRAS